MESDVCGLIERLYMHTQLTEIEIKERGLYQPHQTSSVRQRGVYIINSYLCLIVKHFSEESLHINYLIALSGHVFPYYYCLALIESKEGGKWTSEPLV